MSRYIGAGQNGRFDMRIQELVSKVQNSGRLLRKKRFLGRLHPQPFLAVISACRLIMDIRAKKTNGVGPFFLIRQKHNFFQFSFSSAKHNSLYLLCSRPQDEVFFLKTEYWLAAHLEYYHPSSVKDESTGVCVCVGENIKNFDMNTFSYENL